MLFQFTVSHTNTSIFNIYFSKLYLHLLALFLIKRSTPRLSFIYLFKSLFTVGIQK